MNKIDLVKEIRKSIPVNGSKLKKFISENLVRQSVNGESKKR